MTQRQHDDTLRGVWRYWFKNAILIGKRLVHSQFLDSANLSCNVNWKSKVLDELQSNGYLKRTGPGNRGGRYEYPPTEVKNDKNIPPQIERMDIVRAAMEAGATLREEIKQLQEQCATAPGEITRLQEQLAQTQGQLKASQEQLRERDQENDVLKVQMQDFRRALGEFAEKVRWKDEILSADVASSLQLSPLPPSPNSVS